MFALRISALAILYMCLPAWVVLSALFRILVLSILCMCLPAVVMSAPFGPLCSQVFTCASHVVVMFARAAPQFKKSTGSKSNIDLLFVSNCFGVYVGIID